VLIKQLIIELRNKCSALHSPQGPPNSGDVDTAKDFNEDEPQFNLVTRPIKFCGKDDGFIIF
jgi:hypothetical protein